MEDPLPEELIPSPRLKLDMVIVVSLMIWLFATLEEAALLVPDVLETGSVKVISSAKLLKLKSKAAYNKKYWVKLKIFLI